jgi:peptide-methionine (S)-S-oxide reductase
MATATFAAGCFLSVEAAFRLIPGVVGTEVGYTGGHVCNVTSADVHRGDTGHVESVRIEFDPARLTYEELLDAFWALHDPTEKDGLGPESSSRYRSAIFVHDRVQENKARLSRVLRERSGRHEEPLVTEILPAGDFWRAEEWRQQYFEKRGFAPACEA